MVMPGVRFQGNNRMKKVDKIYYVLRNIEDKPVSMMGYADWFRLIRPDGNVTELVELPEAINNPSLNAATIVATASGIVNPTPGIDVFRYDQNDDPYVINMDHYTVIENFHMHDDYPKVLEMADIEDTQELKWELQNYIYIIKNPPIEDQHWFKDFPEFVLQAKKKI